MPDQKAGQIRLTSIDGGAEKRALTQRKMFSIYAGLPDGRRVFNRICPLASRHSRIIIPGS